MATDVAAELRAASIEEEAIESQLPTELSEFGTTGLKRYGGQISEEYLLDLRGINGIKKYQEMYDNDPIAGGMMFAITRILGRLPWQIEGQPGTDPATLQFVQEAFADMDTPWSQILEDALSLCTYGWAFMEFNLKLRGGEDATEPWQQSAYSDWKIGWRSMKIRSQDTLVQWEYGENGELLGMTQLDPNGGGLRTIPLKKALLFRTTTFKDNPEGRSLLRSAYRPWWYKKRIEDFEGIGIERDLAGLPAAYLPPSYFSVSATPEEKSTLRAMQQLVTDIRNDASGGVVMPVHYDERGNKDVFLELLSSAGQKAFDTNAIITRKSNEMAMSILMDFMMLGHTDTGSFSLGTAKIDLWTMAVEAVAKSVADEFNKAGIQTLLRFNNMSITNPPRLTFGEVSNVDLTELGTYIKDMVAAGALIPDEALMRYVREIAKIPEGQPMPGFDVAPAA